MLAAGMDEPQKDRFIKSAKDVSGAWSAMRAQATIISEIRGALRKKVSIGALVAYGYEAACPKTPTMIPPYLFEHDKFIDWQNSTVKGNGLQYLSVRVVAPPMQPAPAALIRTRVTGTVPKKIGRPSSKNRASEAIWILLKENPEFSALLQKQKIQMVREFILRTYSDEFPGGKGLSDKTLGIHISRFSSRSSD
jgi:hypothetical protein